MALIVVGIILYLISYFNVSIEHFKDLLEPMFYPVSLFENILSSLTMYILLPLFCIFYVSLFIFKYLSSHDQNHNLPNDTKMMASCPECKYKCSSQYYLRRHLKRHSAGLQQQKTFKMKHKGYLIHNILSLVICFLIIWSWINMQDYHSKPSLDKKSSIALSLPMLIYRPHSNLSNSPYHHTRKTILILLLLCGDTDSMKNPGPVSVPTDQLSTGSFINNSLRQNDNSQACNFCDTLIRKNYKFYVCSNSHIFHPRCYKKVVNNSWCTICSCNSLPFANIDIHNEYFETQTLNTNTVVPSQVPKQFFECFKKKGLHFIHLNARSMYNKMSEIKLITKESNPAVLSITETWLDDSHTDDSISIEGYNIVRRDRVTHAGGVIMYIRSDLAYNHRGDLQNDNLEDLWIELLLHKTKPIFVGTCYRAPHNNNFKDCLESTLSKLDSNCVTFILGDFNFCWLKINKNVNFMKNVTQLINSYNFKQVINKATRVTETTATLLDHIYTNNSENTCQSGVIEMGISDHFMTHCT